MKLSQEQIKRLSEWLDAAIKNMNTVHDLTQEHGDHDDALLWVYSQVVSNSLREMRNCITEYGRHSRQHDKEDTQCH